MAEYSRLAKGSFVSTGAAQVINLPFLPDTVEMWNYSSFATPAQHGIPQAYWDSAMGQGFAAVDLYGAAVVGVYGYGTDVIVAGGISTFQAGELLQYGPRKQIIGATAANPIVFNVTAHGYTTGQVVVFEGLYQSATTGMPQIAGIPFQVTYVDADHFSVVWPGNGSNYMALSGSPAGAFVKQVLYPYLYFPGVNVIEAATSTTTSGVQTTTIVTTTPNSYYVGQEVGFRIPAQWGMTQLNSLPNILIPGSPNYGYVVSVTNSTTFVVNINSSAFTAFTTNVAVSQVAGLTFPQVVAVGDVNTGGPSLSAGSVLYPPLQANGVNTINGPGIKGAFANNTSMGFIIGAGGTVTDASAVLVGANTNVIYWQASLHDYASP